MFERFHRNRDDCFGILLFDVQNSILIRASPDQSAVNISTAGAAEDVGCAVLALGNDLVLKDAVGVDKIDKGIVLRRFKQLQDSCRAKRQIFPTFVLEVFTLTMKLGEDPVAGTPEAVEDDANIGRMTIAKSSKCW